LCGLKVGLKIFEKSLSKSLKRNERKELKKKEKKKKEKTAPTHSSPPAQPTYPLFSARPKNQPAHLTSPAR
jgi:hypothetical protein